MSDNDLEVYIYQGNEEERVPETVQELIIKEGVRSLNTEFCVRRRQLRRVTLPYGLIDIGRQAFGQCSNLLEIKIGNTVQIIGWGAFEYCKLLTKIEFESSASAPHQLKTIDEMAFYRCRDLERIKLPSSMNAIGRFAFAECWSLIEADLSNTSIIEISEGAFAGGDSLQTVILPSTMETLGDEAFFSSTGLATLVVPLDSQPIKIGSLAFGCCIDLANVWFPERSTAEEDSFAQCGQLQGRFGEHSSDIVAGLSRRFDGFPIHRMCYDRSGMPPAEELPQFIMDQEENLSVVDEFGMNVFHVLFSAAQPNLDLLNTLLDQYPSYKPMLWNNAVGVRPLEYLIYNWSDATPALLQRVLQQWMIDPMVNWGALLWVEAIETKVDALLREHERERRRDLSNELYSTFVHYEKLEITSILELALWKRKVTSGSGNVGLLLKPQALDRVERRCVCGSDVVIPNVIGFL